MAGRVGKQLLVTLTEATFGEVTLGLRVARELAALGEEVVFLGPPGLRWFLTATPFRHILVDHPRVPIDTTLLRAVRAERFAGVVLLDMNCMLLTLDQLGIDDRFLERIEAPVIVLDIYNLPETDLTVDYGTMDRVMSPRALAFPRWLHPVPFVRPSGGSGCYNALPSLAPIAEARRGRARSELGLGDGDRLVVVCTSRWQSPEVQVWTHHERVARLLPVRLLDMLASLGPRVHVAHLGPAPFVSPRALGDRYHHLGQVQPPRFEELLQSADLQVTFNTAATTSISAIAAGLPVVLGINSHRGATAEEVAASLPRPASPALRAWLEEVVPLYPFRLWPQGFHRFIAPLVRDNPCASALSTLEVLEEERFVETCAQILFEPSRRAAFREGQETYCRAVRRLPSAAELVRSYV
jgi:hypothetical protein